MRDPCKHVHVVTIEKMCVGGVDVCWWWCGCVWWWCECVLVVWMCVGGGVDVCWWWCGCVLVVVWMCVGGGVDVCWW